MTVYIGGNRVARVGVSTAGGVITGPGAITAAIGGNIISLNGDMVASHGMYEHIAATVIASHNTTVVINGILIVVDSDSATCGHSVTG